MFRLPYGEDAVIDFPLIDAGTQDFEATPVTPLAGETKVAHNRLAPANPSGKTRTFTSGGTYEIKPGDTITGATSAATAVVMGVRLTSGTWAAGTAAGILFVRSDSGTFQSENLNVGANTNVATIAGALDAAGLFAHVSTGMYAVGVPGTQLEGARGWVTFVDAATKAWEDQAIAFETIDHPNAADPQGCVLQDTANAAGQTTTNIRLSGDPGITLRTGYFFRVVSGTGEGQAGYIKTYTTGATYDVVPYVALSTALDSTSVVKFYEDAARVPSHLVAKESGVFSELSTAELGTLPVLGTTDIGPLVGWLAMRLGLAKRTFNKSTGVETQRNVADNANRGTATHTDDGTTVTRPGLT